MSICFFDISELTTLESDQDFETGYDSFNDAVEKSGDEEQAEESEDMGVEKVDRIEKYKDIDGVAFNDRKKEKKMIENMKRKDFFDGF